jgi:diguanylate cyclase (GGDEF)-like protein
LFLLTGSHQTFTISQSLSVFSIFLVIQNRRLRYDSLTGLPTMRRFLGSLDRAFRHSHSCAIVLFDISDLKAFNHKFGHKQGDRLLQALAQKLCDESLGEKLKR